VLRADVPVGSYLSGGLDSSLVAALGARAAGRRLKTFSIRFEDAEYDESEYQRTMAERLGTEHVSVVVSKRDIAASLPDVILHTERPILRTAPAPLFLLSALVRREGTKVVLTGEGADEMFAGYDLFREGKVRRFWAKEPGSARRPRLLERLYPYLARSPVAQQAMARAFFGRSLEALHEPGFAHGPRWTSTAALKRLFSPALRDAIGSHDVVRELLADLPADFRSMPPLLQDQYLEIRTLLSGYLLSSQGDRMLMAHSVEGRFPFLDADVIALAGSLPPEYKLRVLDEKHVLKRAAEGLVPDSIVRRPKQPYRAPDAAAFVGEGAPDWVEEVLDARSVADAGVFEPRLVRALVDKCRGRTEGQFSNADNMALVGVLSTGLLHEQLVRRMPSPREISLRTVIDRIES
jgi:asparagine synthase (glutamine-hydrolysing)